MNALIRDTRIRYAFCIVVLAISFLLLGAGRMNGEKKVQSKRARNLILCRESGMRFLSALPETQQESWRELLRKDPELALRSGILNLREIKQNP